VFFFFSDFPFTPSVISSSRDLDILSTSNRGTKQMSFLSRLLRFPSPGFFFLRWFFYLYFSFAMFPDVEPSSHFCGRCLPPHSPHPLNAEVDLVHPVSPKPGKTDSSFVKIWSLSPHMHVGARNLVPPIWLPFLVFRAVSA